MKRVDGLSGVEKIIVCRKDDILPLKAGGHRKHDIAVTGGGGHKIIVGHDKVHRIECADVLFDVTTLIQVVGADIVYGFDIGRMPAGYTLQHHIRPQIDRDGREPVGFRHRQLREPG